MKDRFNVKVITNGSGGVGFIGLLTIAFIVLKLTGHIEWNWLWVLSPLWIGGCCFLPIILLCIVIIAVVAVWLDRK